VATNNGVIYVAYGDKALAETRRSVAGLWQYNDIDVAVIGKKGTPLGLDGALLIPWDNPGPGARWAKLNADLLAPSSWRQVLYLDADTRILGDVTMPFAVLDDGFDLVLAPSENQGATVLCHVGQDDKTETIDALCNPEPLQLQAGVMWFDRVRCARLFEAWRDEWKKHTGQDQGALLRALDREPVRVHHLGRDWNGGGIIEHKFGAAR
jgi:hypothetical protein